MKIHPNAEQQRQRDHPANRAAADSVHRRQQQGEHRDREHLRPDRDKDRPRRKCRGKQEPVPPCGAEAMRTPRGEKCAACDRREDQLQRDETGRAARRIGEPHDRLGEPLMVDPRTIARKGIRVGAVNLPCVDDVAPERQMPPEICVWRSGCQKTDDDQECEDGEHALDERVRRAG